jgi:vacuolar-type H+-ATPase subunit H
MENALRSLKNAEERAIEVERWAAEKGSELTKTTEESVKEMEADVEKRSKEAGVKHLSTRLEGARATSASVRGKVRAEGDDMEKKAKEKLNLGVDQVVDAVVKRMKSGE